MPLDGIWNQLLWQVLTLRPPFSLAHKLSLKETTEGRGGGEKGRDFLVYFAPSGDYQAAGFTFWLKSGGRGRHWSLAGKKNDTNFLLRDSIVISAQGFPRLPRNFTEKFFFCPFLPFSGGSIFMGNVNRYLEITVCLPACLLACLLVYLPVCLSLCLSVENRSRM